MGRRKACEDVQQRTLFSCKNFSGSQRAAAAPTQQTSTCQAGSRAVDNSVENRATNTPCIKSCNPQPAAGASPQKQQNGKHSTPGASESHPSDAQLAHAAAAMAQQVEVAHVALPVAPERSDVMATAASKVSELRAKLNAEQITAATAPVSPPVFILAGAGTGKTTTLTARVWHMLQCGIFPRRILLITFTRKACKELQTRLKYPDGSTPPVQINTFHSWAVRFLQSREVRELANQEKVTVWDNKEQLVQMGDAYQRTQIDKNLLPTARESMRLPPPKQDLPVLDSWAQLLQAAFSDEKLKEPLKAAKMRARERVSEVIKELSVPEAAEEEEHAAQSRPGAPEQKQDGPVAAMTQPAADYDEMIAAPGAGLLPAARIEHVASKGRRSMHCNKDDDADSEDEELDNRHLLDKRKVAGHWVESFFMEEGDEDVSTWTLVAKELLTTYLCQECGIEILMQRGDGAQDGSKPQLQEQRRAMFKGHFMCHMPTGDQDSGQTKLNKAALKKASKSALQYRSFEKRQGAEGLAPDLFNSAVNRCFEQRMKLFKAMDYDEMLSAAEHLLATNAQAREIARRNHAHVLVDEFQDCNNVQVRIVSHLQKNRGQLTVVGDDAQSIYNWRGASNQAFGLLKELLVDPCTDYQLVTNYRSKPAILTVGNCIVQKDMEQNVLNQKQLTCAPGQEHANTAVEYHEFCSSWAEAQWVCDQIQHVHDVENRRWEEIAILTRAMKQNMLFPGQFGVLGHLKTELTKRGIPHRVTRGKTLSDAAEFKQTVALLQLLANRLNDSALFALLSTSLPLKEGIGEAVVSALKKTQTDSGNPEACWQLLQRMARSPQVPTRKRNAVRKFLEKYDWMFRAVMFMKLPDALLFVWKESGIAAAAEKVAQKKKGAQTQKPVDSMQLSATSVAQTSTPAKSNVGASSSRKKAQGTLPSRVQVPDPLEVLVTPVLESMHRHAQEYYDEWSPSELQVDHFKGFQFEQVGSSLRTQACNGFLEPEVFTDAPADASAQPNREEAENGAHRGPPKLVALAAAALWSQPDMKRAGDLMKLSSVNQQLSDVLLSVNKLGYGPVVEFVTNLALHSGEIEEHHDGEETGTGDQGKVTLTTIHSCKGLEWAVVFVVKWQHGVLISPYRNSGEVDAFAGNEDELAKVAMRADARVRGKELQSTEQMLEYLPQWLQMDLLQLQNSEGECRESSLDHLPVWYLRKKTKQHAEEITRLAHVAVTRAKDRLYLSGHRYYETTADASSMGKLIIQHSCKIYKTPPPTSIALPDQPEVISKQVHDGGEIEELLASRALELPVFGAGVAEQHQYESYRSPSRSPAQLAPNNQVVVEAQQRVHELQAAAVQPAGPQIQYLGSRKLPTNAHRAPASRAPIRSNYSNMSSPAGSGIDPSSTEDSPLPTRTLPGRALASTSRSTLGASCSHAPHQATTLPYSSPNQIGSNLEEPGSPAAMLPPTAFRRPPVQHSSHNSRKLPPGAPVNAPFKRPKRDA